MRGTSLLTAVSPSASMRSGATISIALPTGCNVTLGPMMSGSRAIRDASARTCGLIDAVLRPGSGVASTPTAPTAPCPGPVTARCSSLEPWTTASPRGSCESDVFAVRRSITGEAITSSTAVAARNELSGRRITAPVVRCQKPPPDGLPVPKNGIRQRSTFGPSRWSSAGRRVAAASTATATTIIAAAAIDWTARTGMINTVPSDTSTVSPEKTTAVPDVRMARTTASSRATPAASSSRKRASTNSE